MELKTFSGRPASQEAGELIPFIELLRSRHVTSYLEIGTRHGDTFHMIMSALPKGSRGVAVDLPGAAWGTEKSRNHLLKACADLRRHGYVIETILGDSQDPKTVIRINNLGRFDAALIDGDHRYDGVKADLTNYGGIAGLIAFHDIVGTGQTTKDAARHPVEVPRLWAEIKATMPPTGTIEFVAPGSRMGIGCVVR